MTPQSNSSGGKEVVREGAFDLIITDTDLVHRQKHSQGGNKTAKSLWSDFGFVGEIGYSIAIPIVLGALGGAALDKVWGSYPKSALIGIGIGVLLSFATLYQTVKKVIKQSRSR